MRPFTLIGLALLVLVAWHCALAGDPVSPLFHARLDATLSGWERGVEPRNDSEVDPTWWPASANPLSYCVGSVCPASYCIGSVCVSSGCLGSGCLGSTCVGSACVASICAGSGCVGSICGGSVCMGVSLCPKICTDPTNLIVPDFGDPSYLTGDCYDW